MSLFNFFKSKYNENSLLEAYQFQNLNNYDFFNFSFYECARNDILPDKFLEIFLQAHKILENKNLLKTLEEAWILFDLSANLKLSKINEIDFIIQQTMGISKLQYIYEAYFEMTQEEQEVIADYKSEEWQLKVKFLNKETRLFINDDSYELIKVYKDKYPDIKNLILKYNREINKRINYF